MPDYKELYEILFRAMTKAIDLLQKAQQTTEELYIADEAPDVQSTESEKSAEEG